MPRLVLFQPEIPPNTGNVARSCAATCTELHLIEPLGFEISDRTLRRAGLDYWPWVDLHRHRDWGAFQTERRRRGGRLLALSRHARALYHQIRYREDDWLLFGRE
ncbi:MAG: tRNA (cytidine(34)-2'-O)-methyltransferase, partial [Vulcanococcus sp.]